MKGLLKLLLVGLAARWVIGKVREQRARQAAPADTGSP
jgi:hypothetical protein